MQAVVNIDLLTKRMPNELSRRVESGSQPTGG